MCLAKLFEKFISTHALREEGDRKGHNIQIILCYFYPRPPRGGRRESGTLESRAGWISTHALREEGDDDTYICSACGYISTHALREEGDKVYLSGGLKIDISTHALREEGDGIQGLFILSVITFLPTPSVRRATG